MFQFLSIYGKWIDTSHNGITLKKETPLHIVKLFDKIKAEKEKQKDKGIIID